MKTHSRIRPVLLDIANSTQLDQLEAPPRLKTGPIEVINPEDYGKSFDYRIMDGDIFMPASVAGQKWLRNQIGETQHWYSDLDGFFGVKMGKGQGYYQGIFLKAAERDGLINEADYTANMENDALATQWEDW